MFTSLKATKRGFTLIELLVVIAIIGILSSVVLASLATAREKARDATRISDLKNVQLALELFYDSNQGYPVNTAATAGANQFTGATLVAALVPTYIPRMPADPQTATRAAALEYLYVGLTSASAECATAAGTYCVSYGIGATLEREDNSVLDTDVDSWDLGAVFNSLGDTSCGDATDGTSGTTEGCYSLRP